MANVTKLLDIIFGSNPTDDDLRAIIDRLSERLPKETPAPVVDTESASSDEPIEPKSKAKR
jgi:hypothetical protein